MEGIDTVTLRTSGDSEGVTLTGDEFEDAVERITSRPQQLSFDVGGTRPSQIKLALSGKVPVDRQLLKGQRVAVHIIDDDGEILADAHGTVTAIAFVDKADSDGLVTTTREQKITLDT